MRPAIDVARFFLTLSEPDEGDTLSNLKLQKLCYYAQGFALIVLGRPMFSDPIEAWAHGPVVPDVYREFKQYGAAGIPVPDGINLDSFDRDERDLLEEVWNVYGQFSAWKLSNMTHEEPPWKNAPLRSVITHDALREYFRSQVRA